MAEHHDLVIDKGATYLRRFRWMDANRVPVDLTGYEARMHIRAAIEDEATLLELTSEDDGGIVLGGDSGFIDLEIEAGITKAVVGTGGFYDLELEAPSTGRVTRLVQGTVRFDPEVTREEEEAP
jgi:hypothetical protein